MRTVVLMLFLLLLIVSCPVTATEVKILRVIDGDTVVIPFNWPDPLPKEISIRLNSIDTPEKGGRAGCDSERELAMRATVFVKQKVAESKKQEVVIHGFDKYGARLVGDVILDGRNLSKMLIDNGLAISYDGGKKKSWCAVK